MSAVGRPLQNSYKYYQTVKEKQLQHFKTQPKDKLLGAPFRNQDNAKQNIYFKKGDVKNNFHAPFSYKNKNDKKKKCLRKKSFN